ncbi:hotdog fold thioesterase [Candidatus Sumerlaeota bacterium]|nr:hotdog fold thioesterase [Candidatus Sumerlaeota bacterium]
MEGPNPPTAPFPQMVGIEILEASDARAVAALTLTEEHANSLGTCHGGVIFTLADAAFGIAENLDGAKFVAMEMHVRYLRPAFAGQRLTATAELVQSGRETRFYRIDVRDERDRLVACLTGTGHKMHEKAAAGE